jgi:hypothetical protein
MLLWVWTLGLAFGGFTPCPPKGSDHYICWLFCGLSTKFGHSITWPLDFDGHSVKRLSEKGVLHGRFGGGVPNKMEQSYWLGDWCKWRCELNWTLYNEGSMTEKRQSEVSPTRHHFGGSSCFGESFWKDTSSSRVQFASNHSKLVLWVVEMWTPI